MLCQMLVDQGAGSALQEPDSLEELEPARLSLHMRSDFRKVPMTPDSTFQYATSVVDRNNHSKYQ